jgi:hypothetical protein
VPTPPRGPLTRWLGGGAAGESEHPPLVVRAHSKSFLYHMVRLLVGTLKAVGVGELEVADLAKVFAGAPLSRSLSGQRARLSYHAPRHSIAVLRDATRCPQGSSTHSLTHAWSHALSSDKGVTES